MAPAGVVEVAAPGRDDRSCLGLLWSAMKRATLISSPPSPIGPPIALKHRAPSAAARSRRAAASTLPRRLWKALWCLRVRRGPGRPNYPTCPGEPQDHGRSVREANSPAGSDTMPLSPGPHANVEPRRPPLLRAAAASGPIPRRFGAIRAFTGRSSLLASILRHNCSYQPTAAAASS